MGGGLVELTRVDSDFFSLIFYDLFLFQFYHFALNYFLLSFVIFSLFFLFFFIPRAGCEIVKLPWVDSSFFLQRYIFLIYFCFHFWY